MQNYKAANAKYAMFKTAEAVVESVFFRVCSQIIDTFRNSALFVLALQTNDLIRMILNTNYFSWPHFNVVLVFCFIVLLISYVKELFVEKYSNKTKPINEVLESTRLV